MTATRIFVALALLLGTTAIASAQSQRNFGPNGPARFDCYGEPYSGSVTVPAGASSVSCAIGARTQATTS